MSANDQLRILRQFLEQKSKDCIVVVMPDFFLDRIINLELEIDSFVDLISDVVKKKGGSLDGIPQMDLRGGNAINVASALGSLGIHVIPVVCTNEHGFEQLKHSLHNISIDLSHVRILERASMTTALEFSTQNGKANVMLRDLGDLANFGPENLSESDFAAIESADYTCLFNWVGTSRFGTELAKAVFGQARLGKGKTYFDTADPSPRSEAIPDLIQQILGTDLIDILSVNENEAITYAGFLDEGLKKKIRGTLKGDLALDAARVLARHLHARIDLHTSDFSASLKGKKEVVVPTFRIRVLRATGAGDAWDAGNLMGDWNGLSDECRLTLANAVSAYYLQDPNGSHPTKKQLVNFLSAYS